MNPFGSVVEDSIATIRLTLVIAVLFVAAGALAAAGLDMSLFYNTVGTILAVLAIIGAVGFAMWVYNIFFDDNIFDALTVFN
jgi:hypothetical protein